jgi:hypothetical protein
MKISQFLQNAELSNAQYLDCNFRVVPRSELIEVNGRPTKKCLDKMIETIKTGMQKPDVRQKPRLTPRTSTEQVTRTEPDRVVKYILEISKENVGRVIGRNGRNIKKLSETHGVKVTIGNWMEIGWNPRKNFATRLINLSLKGVRTLLMRLSSQVIKQM